MKKLLCIMAVLILLTGCISVKVEDEPETFEEFVDNEMIFSRSMETSNDTGIPNIKVETEEGYEVGSTCEEIDNDLVVVKADDHYHYLLSISVASEYDIEENIADETQNEDGGYDIDSGDEYIKIIPLSEGFYYEVYAEHAPDIEVLEHIKVTEVENKKERPKGAKPSRKTR